MSPFRNLQNFGLSAKAACSEHVHLLQKSAAADHLEAFFQLSDVQCVDPSTLFGVPVFRFDLQSKLKHLRSQCAYLCSNGRIKHGSPHLQHLSVHAGSRLTCSCRMGHRAMSDRMTCGCALCRAAGNAMRCALPVRRIKQIGLDLTSAIHYLHNTACIVHHDVKPANVLVMGDGAIKVCLYLYKT